MKIIGHRETLKKINHLLDAGTVGHAYLFVGPVHVGKTTVAQAFAAALVSGETMCGELLTHPDIQIIRPEQIVTKSGSLRTKDIGVETARMISTDAARTPLAGVRRVIIITESDCLTVAAQNTLLKTLEEPAERTVLILTALREGRLLSTVRSRMQRFALAPVDDDVMSAAAKGFFDDDVSRTTALAVAHGCPGILMALAADADDLAWYQIILDDAQRIVQMTRAQKIVYAEKLATDIVRAKRALVVWMHVWREQLYSKDNTIAREIIAQRLVQAQETFDILENTQANPRLRLENFLFTLV